MNIAMLQTVPTNMSKQVSHSNTIKSSAPDAKVFGSVFQSIVSKSNETVQQIALPEQSLAKSVTDVLENDSLKELLQQLGIEMDESELFAFIGEESTPIAVDEMLSLENIADLVGMTEEQLTQIIDQLLGDTKYEIKDIWSVIEQSPQILSEVLATIRGLQQSDSLNLQPKELQQVVQFLKLTELLGNKVDTVYQQEVQLGQLKEALLALAKEARKTVDLEQNTTKTSTFQQIVQQVTQQSSQQSSQNQSQQNQQTTVKIESDTQSAIQLQQQATQIKNVTITLPAEKPAQSEALLKEIQNLINRSQLSGQPGNMKLFLKLFPENLGQIRIELVQKDGVLTARLLATTAMGKELLESNINQLKAGFVAQNIQMDRIDVAQSLQDADRNTRDQSFFNNFFGKQKDEELDEKEETPEEEVISFKDLLSEEV